MCNQCVVLLEDWAPKYLVPMVGPKASAFWNFVTNRFVDAMRKRARRGVHKSVCHEVSCLKSLRPPQFLAGHSFCTRMQITNVEPVNLRAR